MVCQIITHRPQDHIQVCHLIGTYRSRILKSEIIDSDYYGNFVLEIEENLYYTLLMIPDIELKKIE